MDQIAEGATEFVNALAAQLPLIGLGIVVAIVLYLASRLVRRTISRSSWIADDSLRALTAGLASAGTIVLGVFLGLVIAIPGVSFTELLASLGVSGIVLGFALRDILENFVAGIIILARRPFGVDDQIRSGDYEGTVKEINFRSTVLRTYDGLQVFVPNGQLLTAPVENLTGYAERRSEVVLGIHQDASVADAREIILAELERMDDVLSQPGPQVFFDAIGDSTNDLHVLYWTEPPTRFHQRITASEVTERLYSKLGQAGIEFPYPIQTIQLDRGSAA